MASRNKQFYALKGVEDPCTSCLARRKRMKFLLLKEDFVF